MRAIHSLSGPMFRYAPSLAAASALLQGPPPRGGAGRCSSQRSCRRRADSSNSQLYVTSVRAWLAFGQSNVSRPSSIQRSAPAPHQRTVLSGLEGGLGGHRLVGLVGLHLAPQFAAEARPRTTATAREDRSVDLCWHEEERKKDRGGKRPRLVERGCVASVVWLIASAERDVSADLFTPACWFLFRIDRAEGPVDPIRRLP